MSAYFLPLLLLAAPAPIKSPPKTAAPLQAAPPPVGAAANPVAVAAQAADRCMTAFAVKLTATNLTDDNIFTVANVMCEPLLNELIARINANLPKAKADELVGKMNTNRRPSYANLLKVVREGRATGKIK